MLGGGSDIGPSIVVGLLVGALYLVVMLLSIISEIERKDK